MANNRNNHRTKSLLFENSGGTFLLPVMTGGPLLEFSVHQREYLYALPWGLGSVFGNSTHLISHWAEFLWHKQAFCKESLNFMFWGLCILLEILVPASWESEVQFEALLTLVFIFATKYIVYWGEEGFIACAGIMTPHCSNNLVNRKEGSNVIFWA